MKKFKNKLAISGSESLKKAFIEELIALGYELHNDMGYYFKGYIQVNQYGGPGKYVLASNNIHDYAQDVIHLELPRDWNKALQLAAEVEIEVPEYVECIKDFSSGSEIKKGTIWKTCTKGYPAGEYRVVWPDGSGQTTHGKEDYFIPSTKEEYEAQFKVKPKVGKWYTSKLQPGILVYCTGLASDDGIIGFGFDANKNWVNNGAEWFMGNFKHAVIATQKEVEKALVAEARRRGFVNGVKFKCAVTSTNSQFDDQELYEWQILDLGFSKIANQYLLNFRKGKWAEILPQEVKVNGYVVTKIDSGTVKVGCKTMRIEWLKQLHDFIQFYGGTYKYENIEWTRSDIGKIIDEFNKM